MADTQEGTVEGAVVAPVEVPQEPTSTEEGGTTTEEPKVKDGETIEIEADEITRDNDGNFVWQVDPNDPKSTIYKGKSLKELFANAQAGFVKKDEYIRELVAKSKIPTASHSKSVKGEDDSAEVDFPSQDAIIDKHAKQAGISPEMLSYSEEQWREYADEKGLRDFQVSNLISRVDRVRQHAEAEFSEKNVEALNELNGKEENRLVAEMVAESGIDPEKFDYEAVWEAVNGNPKNFNKAGVRKAGVVVKEAAKVVRESLRSTLKSRLEQEIVDEIASGKRRAVKVSSEGASKSRVNSPTSKDPTDFEEATRQAIEALKK